MGVFRKLILFSRAGNLRNLQMKKLAKRSPQEQGVKIGKMQIGFWLRERKGCTNKAGIFLVFSASSFQLVAVQVVLTGLLPTQSDQLPDHHNGGSCECK